MKNYHNREELSASQVRQILKNPFKFTNKSIKKTASMLFGAAAHKLVFEKEKFFEEFEIFDKKDKKNVNGTTKELISQEEYEQALLCANAVKLDAAPFLKEGVAEQAYFSELGGVKVRCKVDYYVERLGLIIDLKTSKDATNKSFSKAIADNAYHVQAAFYIDLLASLNKKVNKFLFIVVENFDDFRVAFYELSETAISLGRSKYLEAIEIYKNINKLNSHIYTNLKTGEIVQSIDLPRWAYYE